MLTLTCRIIDLVYGECARRVSVLDTLHTQRWDILMESHLPKLIDESDVSDMSR